MSEISRRDLDGLLWRYQNRDYLASDPVQFLHRYRQTRDRELAGMVAVAHALGRVPSILATLEKVFAWLGPNPGNTAASGNLPEFFFSDAPRYYRFFTRNHLEGFLLGIGNVLKEHGSLEAVFPSTGGIWERVETWLNRLRSSCPTDPGMLLPRGDRKSVFKRPFLFLKWMVRRDSIDPGGWTVLKPSELMVPLDTHMYQWGKKAGWITGNRPDRKAVEELTQGFRSLSPEDPCRWDFALTRPGILHGQKKTERL